MLHDTWTYQNIIYIESIVSVSNEKFNYDNTLFKFKCFRKSLKLGC